MNTSTKDWGLTLIRFWIGLLIAYGGFLKAEAQLSALNLAGGLLGLWKPFFSAPWAHAVALVELLGGAAIFLGVTVRLAALLCAVAVGFDLWEGEGLDLDALLRNRLAATLLVTSLALIFTGPGRLNLGGIFRKRR